MRNIKLTLQFDGTAYHGWQKQSNALAIQEIIENAVEAITGRKTLVVGCGRTDTGVHATGYVCNFKSETKIPAERIHLALNTHLPEDIICVAAEEVSDGFHAKSSAIKKRYTYYISNTPFPDLFSYSWHYRYALDIGAMRRAAKAFIGTHDFVGFASTGFSVLTTVRTIYALEVRKESNLIAIDVTGNGFLYNMVRIIAGTLAYAGSGKIDPDEIPDIIASCDRERAGITAPAEGLFLSEVHYNEE